MLFRIFNELFTNEAQLALDDQYKGCMAMLETERANLLGLIGHHPTTDPNDTQQQNQNSFERMQRFLTHLHESCYHMMGSIGPSLGRDLYTLPDLGPAIVNSILSSLHVGIQFFYCFL